LGFWSLQASAVGFQTAELIIRERKVTETRKVGVDLITEQLTVRNPTADTSGSENDE